MRKGTCKVMYETEVPTCLTYNLFGFSVSFIVIIKRFLFYKLQLFDF
jgi:hypothetical protein